jgi:CP family cyanate transporter-like MFS transporter
VSAAATGTISVHMGHDWRFASGVWSVLGLIAVAAWITVMIVERKIIGNGSVSRTNSAVLPIRNGKAWLVALFFACDNFLFYALLSWTAPMYQEHGFPTTKAGFLLASYTLAFMCACPVFGSLSKSHDRRMWLAACALLTGAGLIGLAFAPVLAPFLWVPLAAIGLGGGFTLGMTLPLDNTHTADETNTWNAFTMTVGYLIAALGPFLVGALRDVTGSFRISTIVLVAVSVVMLAFTPFLKPAPNGSQLAVD